MQDRQIVNLKKRRRRIGLGERHLPFALGVIGVVMSFYILFTIYPLVQVFRLSFYEWNLLNPVRFFKGIENFIEMFQNKLFWYSLKNTFYYVGVVGPLQISLALILALLLNINRSRTRGFFLSVYFFAYITSMVASALVWKWLYQPQLGLFNILLETVSLNPQRWLDSTKTALLSIMVMSIWKGFGYGMIIFIGGLQGIPNTLYEASEIDGATRWRKFYSITLPLLKPSLVFILIVTLISTFRAFAPIYVMTSAPGYTSGTPLGGPADSTTTLIIYLYKVAFWNFRMGYGAAVGLILFLIILLFTGLQLKFGRVKWEY